MDKAFENMDKRFKNIEEELNYNYDSNMWRDVEGMLGDKALDEAFVNAAKTAVVNSNIDFDAVDNAFLDEAFIEAAKQTEVSYDSSYFNEFKNVEADLVQNESFVNAAMATSAVYNAEYWADADLALQAEGLHHEYKTDYWKEAEKLLLKDARKGFFFKWGAAATLLILLSILGYKSNEHFGDSTDIVDTEKTVPASNEKVSDLADNNTLKGEKNIQNQDKVNTIEGVSNNQTQVDFNTDKIKTLPTNTNNINHNLIDNQTVNTNNHKSSTDIDIAVGEQSSNQLTNVVNKQDENTQSNSANKSMVKTNQENTENYTETVFSDLEQKEDLKIKDVEIHKMNRNLSVFIGDLDLNEDLVENKIEYTPLNPVHQFAIKMEKGLGNSFGSTNSAISPRNSMYFDYRFNPVHRFGNVQFGIDLGMYHMNLDNYEYERKYSIYSIEGTAEHYWYRMTYKDIIYMSTKFNTYFRLGSNSRIRLGLGIDRLLTTRIKMEYKDAANDETVDVGDDWGVNEGINKMDFNLGLGYELKLNSKFSFLIDSRMGLGDKTNNDYLKVKRNDQDLSIQFGIKYNIFATH